jgi:hypothetical protein
MPSVMLELFIVGLFTKSPGSILLIFIDEKPHVY